jgi:hypothetical protein
MAIAAIGKTDTKMAPINVPCARHVSSMTFPRPALPAHRLSDA